jgi:diguanylate cyclase (GGDEF)-like protein/PAS domain S-box-containing protein
MTDGLRVGPTGRRFSPQHGRAELVRSWATLLEDGSFSAVPRDEIDSLTSRLTDSLIRAMVDQPLTMDLGQQVGSALVEARLTRPGALGGTVRLIGDLLPDCMDPSSADRVRSQVSRLQEAVVDGYSQALLTLALSEQEQIRRAALAARDQAEAALRISEARFRALFTDAAVGITVADVGGRILDVNPALMNMLGYGRGEFHQRAVTNFMHPDDAEVVWSSYRELVEGRRDYFWAEKRFVRADGRTLWAHLTVSLIRDQDGEPWHLMAIVEDVTDRHQLQDRLAHEASHDPLTGLPNRALFLARLTEALADTESEGQVGLCFLDLDSFKVINDSFGHVVGDHLLITIAQRLQECVVGTGMIARLGGDEFVALIPVSTGPEQLGRLTDWLLAAVSRPVIVDGHRLSVSASIGVVEAPAGQSSPTDLIRAADITLQQAKAEGKGRAVQHDPDRGANQVTLYTLAATLPGAVDRGEFVLLYQPLIRMRDGHLHGVEALLRWEHPQFGTLSPDHFIQLAEETGAILPLGRWILGEACRQVATRTDLPDDLLLSVNVAVRQLQQASFVDDVVAALDKAGLAANRLQLEVTESEVMAAEAAGPLTALRRLADLGVRIAVDDFGTGYSNFVYLRRLPVHELKLDGAFLDGLRPDGPLDPADLHLVATLIDLAHGLGITVTAEGVETAAQADHLRALCCDTVQGWHLGRPTNLDAIAERASAER